MMPKKSLAKTCTYDGAIIPCEKLVAVAASSDEEVIYLAQCLVGSGSKDDNRSDSVSQAVFVGLACGRRSLAFTPMLLSMLSHVNIQS